MVIFFSALTAPWPNPSQEYWDKTILPGTVQPFGLFSNFGRGGAPAPTDTPAESPKWPKMAKTGFTETKLIGGEVKNGMMNPLSGL